MGGRSIWEEISSVECHILWKYWWIGGVSPYPVKENPIDVCYGGGCVEEALIVVRPENSKERIHKRKNTSTVVGHVDNQTRVSCNNIFEGRDEKVHKWIQRFDIPIPRRNFNEHSMVHLQVEGRQ